MKTVTVAICKACNQPILDQPGVILHGNLYELTSGADIEPGPGAGLTPNAFPANSTSLGVINGRPAIMSPADLQKAVVMEAYHTECLAPIIIGAAGERLAPEASHAA